MATVYLVRHVDLGTAYAMKVLHVPAAAIQQRLLLEGRVQSRLRHANLVAVTDMVDVESAPGLVMEWVAGPPLDQWLQHTRLSWPQADALARGILAGVAHAHAHGLVHRDLKPANVLLALEPTGVVPKVSDFGLAKLLSTDEGGPSQTRSGIAMGSPAYMSPEQIRDARRVDQRADVFALGAVLYELATGIRAFGGGGDALEIFDHIRRGAFRDPRELAPELPESCATLIERCLSIDRDDRPADAAAVLEAWIADRPEPREPFTEEEIAELESLAPEPRPLGASLDDLSTGSETFGEFDLSMGEIEVRSFLGEPAEPTAEVPPPEPRARRWTWVAAAAALVALVLVLPWRAPPPPAFTAEAPLLAQGEAQQALADGWERMLHADFEGAIEQLEAAAPSPLVDLAIALARRQSLQRGAGNEALWNASKKTGPGAELAQAVLALHAKRIEDPAAPLAAYRAQRPDDVLAALWVLELLPPNETEARDAAMRDIARTLPEQPLPVWLTAAEALRAGDVEGSQRFAREGLERFSDEPALLLALGRALAAEGRMEEARAPLRLSFELAPSAATRNELVASLLLAGEDASGLIGEGMDPARPVEQHSAFAISTANTLAGLGRVQEAVALLAEAEDRALAEGQYSSTAAIVGTEAVIYMITDLDERMAATTDRLQQFLLNPEIPDGERNILVRNLTYAQGMTEARRGNLDAARTIVERLRTTGVGPVYLEWLEREIAIRDGDTHGALALFETQPEGCERTLLEARAADVSGSLDRAASFAVQALDGHCPATGELRLLQAAAWVIRADHALAEGRPGEASEALSAYDALWPRPDRELPLVLRADALRAVL